MSPVNDSWTRTGPVLCVCLVERYVQQSQIKPKKRERHGGVFALLGCLLEFLRRRRGSGMECLECWEGGRGAKRGVDLGRCYQK